MDIGRALIKLQPYVLDTDKDPDGVDQWITHMLYIAESHDEGPVYVEWVECKLGLQKNRLAMLPAIIVDDPELEISRSGHDFLANSTASSTIMREEKRVEGSPAVSDTASGQTPGSAPGSAPSQAPGEETSTTNAQSMSQGSGYIRRVMEMDEQPGTNGFRTYATGKKFSELPKKPQQLDRIMGTMASNNLVGKQGTLIQLSGGGSFIRAAILLMRHRDLHACNRKVRAFRNMTNLKFKGDAAKWQMETLRAAMELQNARCTILEWTVLCIKQSLGSAGAFVKYDMAKLIERGAVQNTSDIYEMLHEVAKTLTTAGDQTEAHINLMGGEQEEEDETAGSDMVLYQGGDKSSNKKTKKKIQEKDADCWKCGKTGHFARNCPEKNKDGGSTSGEPAHQGMVDGGGAGDGAATSSDAQPITQMAEAEVGEMLSWMSRGLIV